MAGNDNYTPAYLVRASTFGGRVNFFKIQEGEGSFLKLNHLKRADFIVVFSLTTVTLK